MAYTLTIGQVAKSTGVALAPAGPPFATLVTQS